MKLNSLLWNSTVVTPRIKRAAYFWEEQQRHQQLLCLIKFTFPWRSEFHVRNVLIIVVISSLQIYICITEQSLG